MLAFSILPLLHLIIDRDSVSPPKGPELIAPVLPEPVIPRPPESEPIVKALEKPDLKKIPPEINPEQIVDMLKPGTGDHAIDTDFRGFVESLENVFERWDVEEKPRVIVAVEPMYPYTVRGEEGKVIVEFIIDTRGSVRSLRIIKSSHRDFESPALEAVQRSQWQPGKIGGQAVATRVQLPVIFKR